MDGFLLFTSFNHGEHSNVFCSNAEDILSKIESSLDGDALRIFYQEKHEILDEINALENVNDDCWNEATDGTWFTITKTTIDCK